MSPTQQEQFIVRLSIENVKQVRVMDVMPNRYVTKISGANGAGKTSALDAVFHALAPRKTITPTLLRQGEKKGFIRVETNTHIITRHLDQKGGTLEIESKSNKMLIKAPDDWLQEITGELGFDPLRFMRLKPEEQFDVLKGLVKLEADLDDLQLRNETDSRTITDRKAEARRLETLRDHTVVDRNLPAEPINVDDLLSEARAISAFNTNIEAQRREREDETNVRNQLVRAIEERTKRINELRAELQRLEGANNSDSELLGKANATINAWKPLPEPKDRAAIDEQISASSATNARINSNNANREQQQRLDTEVKNIKDDLEKLEKNIRERKLTIARTLEKAKFPVPGLSFETQEEGSAGRERKNPKKIVTYNGLPLSDASSAEQIRVSTAIGMAGKPEMRFLLIREGSLLDDNGWSILEEMAHEHGFQILAEQVDTSGKVGIFLQNGEVKAVNQPEPEKKTAAKKTTKKEQGELIK
jgi:hypothetical protein